MFADLETKQHNLTLICYKFCHIFTRAAQRDSNLSRRQIVTLHEQSYLWCLIIKVLPVRWWMSLLASSKVVDESLSFQYYASSSFSKFTRRLRGSTFGAIVDKKMMSTGGFWR